MSKEEKHELLLSPATKETTPLLRQKEVVDPYSKVIKPGLSTSETTCEPGSSAAGTSRTCEKDEASSSAADAAVVEADKSTKCPDNKEEMADFINSYEGMVDIVSPSFGCGLLCGIWLCMCHCLSSFMIQFPLHVLLLSLPISVGFMGAKYMTQCPVNTKLPYSMMVVGALGTLALLVRLATLLHRKFSTNERLKKWLKKGTKLMELAFLISLIIEFCFSYKMSPSDDPLSPNYCEKSFYSFVSSINNVWITLVVVWIFVYFLPGQRCMRRVVPP